MKKIFLLLFVVILSASSYGQAGDLFVGAKGGYVTSYKDLLYGFDVAYHLADPLEISFTGLMNPDMKVDDEIDGKSKISLYSANLDMRYYLLLQRTWGMGPALGGQYMYLNKKVLNSPTNEEYSSQPLGFNIGWHMRFNLTENVKVNGGWRYTTANKDASHHLIYIGLGYTFNLF